MPPLPWMPGAGARSPSPSARHWLRSLLFSQNARVWHLTTIPGMYLPTTTHWNIRLTKNCPRITPCMKHLLRQRNPVKMWTRSHILKNHLQIMNAVVDQVLPGWHALKYRFLRTSLWQWPSLSKPEKKSPLRNNNKLSFLIGRQLIFRVFHISLAGC